MNSNAEEDSHVLQGRKTPKVFGSESVEQGPRSATAPEREVRVGSYAEQEEQDLIVHTNTRSRSPQNVPTFP